MVVEEEDTGIEETTTIVEMIVVGVGTVMTEDVIVVDVTDVDGAAVLGKEDGVGLSRSIPWMLGYSIEGRCRLEI